MEHQYKDTLTHFTISVGRSAGRCSTTHRRSRSTSWRTVTRGNMCARCAARRSSGRTTCEYRWTQFTSFLRQLINVDIVFLASVISKKKKKRNTVNDNSMFPFFFFHFEKLSVSSQSWFSLLWFSLWGSISKSKAFRSRLSKLLKE